MEDGWKWKHINRSTILYKLLHKFDKLLKKRNPLYERIAQQTEKKKTEKKSEHWSQEDKKPGAQIRKVQ